MNNPLKFIETDNRPLVSIIMAAYNAQSFIGQAINSVLSQTYTNWELLIVNDGSKDETEAEILKFKDPRISYFKQANKGVSSARNKGLEQMKGDFFCMLDSDDMFPPKSIESRIDKFLEAGEIEFVDGTVLVKDKNLDITIRTIKFNFYGNPLNSLIRLDGRSFFGPSWMIRIVPGKKYRFKEGMTHGEELMLYINIGQTGVYAAVEEPILLYRVSGTSAMSNLKGLEEGYVQLYLEVKAFPHISKKKKKYLKNRICRIMFLSYLSKNKLISAIRVVFRYLSL
jgi:glycosyltransferase involved in cell wall biosynthesis